MSRTDDPREIHAYNSTCDCQACGRIRTFPSALHGQTYLPTDVGAELHDIGVMQTVLEAMSPVARRRVLAYLNDRYGARDA